MKKKLLIIVLLIFLGLLAGCSFIYKKITVIFDKNNGTQNVQIKINYNTKIKKIDDPDKYGYTFDGWYISLDYDKEWDFTDTVTENMTLYAKWEPNVYLITLDKNEGHSGNPTVIAVFDEIMPVAEAPVRTGYKFDGYYDEPEGQGKRYYESNMDSDVQWDKDKNTVLYANWIIDSYEITLITDNLSTKIICEYNKVLPEITVPYKIGHIFKGYFDQQNGQGTRYYDEDGTPQVYDKGYNNTFYAYFIPIESVITFNNDGGIGDTSFVNAIFSKQMPQATAPVKLGYIFSGYFDEINGGGNQYYLANMQSARNWDKTENTVLYAFWAYTTYTITFNKTGGIGGSDVLEAYYNNPMPEGSKPIKLGYIFSGYFDEENGEGNQYYLANMQSARKWDKDFDGTLYAYWIIETYDITFDNAGGGGGTQTAMVQYGTPMPEAEAPMREGYIFKGYFDGENGEGRIYYSDDMQSARNWDKDSSAILYAYWVGKTYDITFDNAGGGGGTQTITVQYGSPMPEAEAPVREGYTFNGYFDNEDGEGRIYYSDDMQSARNWDKDSSTILYAYWISNQYRVELYSEGGYDGTLYVMATYGQNMPEAVAPLKEGYLFVGYFYHDKQYYDSLMNSCSVWDIANSVVLIAIWEEIFEVELDKQYGYGGTNVVNVTLGDEMPIASAPIYDGYDFLGYYSQKDGQGTRYYNSGMESVKNYDIENDTILYAYWVVSNATSYDPRTIGYMTIAKDQVTDGTCWIFAAVGGAETYIKKMTGRDIDFSEEYIKWLLSNQAADPFYDRDPDEGGNTGNAIAWLTTQVGLILEEEMPYNGGFDSSYIEDFQYYIKSAISLQMTIEEVKEGILKSGAVMVSYSHQSLYLNTSTESYYCPLSSFEDNHAVIIVGWDDNYSRNNFRSLPSGNGAWLVRNSWGPSWGDNGYFWISYYDKTLMDGDYGWIYTDIQSANENEIVFSYEKYLITGYYTMSNVAYMANVFNFSSQASSYVLDSVTFSFLNANYLSTTYSVYLKSFSSTSSLNINNLTNPIGTGNIKSTEYTGYINIKLDNPFTLVSPYKYAVIVKLNASGTVCIPCVVPDGDTDNADFGYSGSFYSQVSYYYNLYWRVETGGNIPIRATLTKIQPIVDDPLIENTQIQYISGDIIINTNIEKDKFFEGILLYGTVLYENNSYTYQNGILILKESFLSTITGDTKIKLAIYFTGGFVIYIEIT